MKVFMYNGSTCNQQGATFAWIVIWAPAEVSAWRPTGQQARQDNRQSNPFWPQEPLLQPEQKTANHGRNRLSISRGVFHWAVRILKGSALVQKRCSTESPSREESECNPEGGKKKKRMPSEFADHGWKLPEASWCYRLIPSGKTCQEPSALNSEVLLLISRARTLSLFADWHFLAYKATCPRGQAPSSYPAATPNSWLSHF